MRNTASPPPNPAVNTDLAHKAVQAGYLKR